jgi:F0F1-type ATP synthase epsilon subunit
LAYDVSGGFLSVTEAGVTVLAEDCMPAEPHRDER